MLTPSLSRNNFRSCVRNGLLHAMQCSELEPSMQAGSIGLQFQCLSQLEDKITVQCPVSVTDAVFGVLENKRDYSDPLLSSLQSLCLWEADKVFWSYSICIISECLQESFWVSYLAFFERFHVFCKLMIWLFKVEVSTVKNHYVSVRGIEISIRWAAGPLKTATAQKTVGSL